MEDAEMIAMALLAVRDAIVDSALCNKEWDRDCFHDHKYSIVQKELNDRKQARDDYARELAKKENKA